jgi:large subunit ribosomal protein L6
MSNMLTPVEIPDKVDATVQPQKVRVKGPLGELEHELPDQLEVQLDADGKEMLVTRHSEERQVRALHGLHRSLLANMVEGVSKGYEKKMEVHGTGYNVNLRGNTLVLQIGFCHDVQFDVPENIEVEIEQNAAQPDNPARFTVRGIDKQQLGQFCADIRDVRPPEPYKGKGIRYADEHVRRKEGKAFAGLE